MKRSNNTKTNSDELARKQKHQFEVEGETNSRTEKETNIEESEYSQDIDELPIEDKMLQKPRQEGTKTPEQAIEFEQECQLSQGEEIHEEIYESESETSTIGRFHRDVCDI